MSDGVWFWIIIGVCLGGTLLYWSYHIIKGSADEEAAKKEEEG